jgi:hypothetical protein
MADPQFYRRLHARVIEQLRDDGLVDSLLLMADLGRSSLKHHFGVDVYKEAWEAAGEKSLEELASDVRGAPVNEDALHSAIVIMDKLETFARLESFGPIDEWVEEEEFRGRAR